MNAPTFWTPKFVITTQKDGIVTMQQTGELPPYRPTIIASLIHWATQCPDRIFLAERDAEQRWATLTYADALAYSRALAAGLLEQGLGPDKPLLLPVYHASGIISGHPFPQFGFSLRQGCGVSQCKMRNMYHPGCNVTRLPSRKDFHHG